MDMNRIKIGDVWYVREDKTPTEPKEQLEIILSREVVIETEHVLVVGSVLENESTLKPGVMTVGDNTFCIPSLEITFKNSDRDSELWDNEEFLSGVASRLDVHMQGFYDVGNHTKEVVIAVIDKMRKLGWI